MKKRITSIAVLLAASALGCWAATAGTNSQKVTNSVTNSETLTQQQKALHILDRFTFGPQPGEADAVARMGWQKWFREQLQPNTIDDSALDARLSAYPALSLSPSDLLAALPNSQTIRQIAFGHADYSQDWMVRGLEQVLVMKFQQKKLGKHPAREHAPQNQMQNQMQQAMQQAPQQTAQDGDSAPPALPTMLDSAAGTAAANVTDTDTNTGKAARRAEAQQLAGQILAAAPDARMAAVMQLPVPQRAVLAESVYGRPRAELLQGFTPREQEIFLAMGRGPDAVAVADNELQQAAILRAILSQRQLQEVMTEFWFNHFNVYMRKNADQWYTPSYVRNVIRPYALSSFPDLLLATAQSPAMLYYLDNWLSMGPNSPAAERLDARKKQQPHGINENYGREVMELHTVGLGYTQADVIAMADIMTGWTIRKPQDGGNAIYMPMRHQPGNVEWFGHTVRDNGYQEGRAALLWLAMQPATAHHICYELAQRFVADNPPPALVSAMAATYMRTNGNIRQILWTMVNSPEFWSPRYMHNKVKTPLDFVASAFRATGTAPTNPVPLVYLLRQMGEPLFQCEPPNGYPMTGDAWMNTGALVARLNFAMRLTGNRFGGMKMDPSITLADEEDGMTAASAVPASYSTEDGTVLDDLKPLELALLGRRASAKTEGVIEQQVKRMPTASREQKLRLMAALLLGSPDFQMR